MKALFQTGPDGRVRAPSERRFLIRWIVIGVGSALALTLGDVARTGGATKAPGRYTGSGDCRSCHEEFYKKWSTSWHGLAMQTCTADFAAHHLTPMTNEIVVGPYRYRADVTNLPPVVRETGPAGSKDYRMEHALGGKNVYYFLASLDRGRLQTLPVAYDARRREWFDTSASAMRHFPDVANELIHWTEPPYTFNTSCHGCHISQLSRNYTPVTDTYRTTWVEPGINCETCHGPGSEHVRVCIAAHGDQPPADLKIIRTSAMTPAQRDDLCVTCHAKASVLSETYTPGARFDDHFGLVTLESPDYYPDGRDLGENYTCTSWLLSPCRQSPRFECNHCHTSSGRFRQRDNPNAACLPCHEQRVKEVVAHSRHEADSSGSRCIACHMPRTEFGRMIRSDHSLLPPTPSATLAFGSPNACNVCHTEQDAAWADRHVRSWHTNDYQAPVLERAGLVAAARRREWTKLADMSAYLVAPNRQVVFSASLIRLLESCGDEAKWPALRAAAADPAPLVRAAATQVLGSGLHHAAHRALVLQALTDDYRVVRLAAGSALIGYPRSALTTAQAGQLDRVLREYVAMLQSRPDSSIHQYNLGNYYQLEGNRPSALAAYRRSIQLDPANVQPLVNLSLLCAQDGRLDEAESLLRQALKQGPDNAAVNFNLGLLMAERGNVAETETLLRAALRADPTIAAAAYNLAVIVSRDRPAEALALCRQAAQHSPAEPKYGYTLAFYQRQTGDLAGAVATLESLLRRNPDHLDSVMLLGDIHEQAGRPRAALAVYQRALTGSALPANVHAALLARMARLQPLAP